MSEQLTSTTAAAFLQRYYAPGYILNTTAVQQSKMLGQIKRNERAGGDSYNFLCVLDDVATGSATFSSAQDMAANSTITIGSKFNLDWVESHDVARISGKLIAQTKRNIATWAPMLTHLVDSALRRSIHRASVALYTRGWGELSQITSVSGATFKPKIASQIHRYFRGQYLVFSSSLNAAVLRSATAIKITGINYSTNTITCDTNLSTPGGVDDDWCFTAGDRENSATPSRLRPVGLRSWLPSESSVTDANDITIGGVTRSTDTRHYGWRVNASTGKINDAARTLCSTLTSYGNAKKLMMFTSPTNFDTLASELGGDRRYVDIKGHGGVGFRTLEVYADGVSCPVVADKYCDDTTSYIGDPATIECASMGPVPHIDDEDGQRILRISDARGYEVRFVSDYQLGMKDPAAWGKLDHVGV